MIRELPDDLIILSEAAKLLPSRKPGRGMHQSTLYRWAASGRLRRWRVGRYWYVRRADVLALAKEETVVTTETEAAARQKRTREVLARHGVG